MRWGKKKKYRSVGKECRITRCPVSIWSVFVCLSVKMVYFFCLSVRYCQVARSSVTLAANVLRVAAVGDFGALNCHPALKFDRSTQLQFCTSTPIEATRCWQLAFLSTVSESPCPLGFYVKLSVCIFGLCVGLCECGMCVTAAWAKTFLLIV